MNISPSTPRSRRNFRTIRVRADRRNHWKQRLAAPQIDEPDQRKGCRTLRFQSIDDMLSEAMKIAAWEREGSLRTSGTWTAGQTFGHLAAWMSYPYDGYPISVPWFVRLLMPLMKNRVLTGKMPAGRRIPGVRGGTTATEVLPLDEGLRRFTSAAERLRRTTPSMRNPLFGKLTHAEWIALNLRHAELHFSFFDSVPAAVA